MPNSDNRYYKHSLFGSRRDFLKLAAVAGSLPIPVHVATGEADLAAELKRGLAYVRGEKRKFGGSSKSRR